MAHPQEAVLYDSVHWSPPHSWALKGALQDAGPQTRCGVQKHNACHMAYKAPVLCAKQVGAAPRCRSDALFDALLVPHLLRRFTPGWRLHAGDSVHYRIKDLAQVLWVIACLHAVPDISLHG